MASLIVRNVMRLITVAWRLCLAPGDACAHAQWVPTVPMVQKDTVFVHSGFALCELMGWRWLVAPSRSYACALHARTVDPLGRFWSPCA